MNMLYEDKQHAQSGERIDRYYNLAFVSSLTSVTAAAARTVVPRSLVFVAVAQKVESIPEMTQRGYRMTH